MVRPGGFGVSRNRLYGFSAPDTGELCSPPRGAAPAFLYLRTKNRRRPPKVLRIYLFFSILRLPSKPTRVQTACSLVPAELLMSLTV